MTSAKYFELGQKTTYLFLMTHFSKMIGLTAFQLIHNQTRKKVAGCQCDAQRYLWEKHIICVLTFSSARCGEDRKHFCVGSMETGKDDGRMQVFQGMGN